MLVRECLKGMPVMVPPGCSLAAAASLMGDHGVSSLLVVQDGHLVGILTDRDITVRGTAAGLPPEAEVISVMSRDPVTIQGSDHALDAFRALRAATRAGYRCSTGKSSLGSSPWTTCSSRSSSNSER